MIRNAGGRATDDAIRSLAAVSHKLLGTRTWLVVHHTNCGMELFTDQGTRTWLVVHHTNCGMELFTDQVMGELLEDDLGTASFDGSLVQPAPPRRPCRRPLHQMAHDRRCEEISGWSAGPVKSAVAFVSKNEPLAAGPLACRRDKRR